MGRAGGLTGASSSSFFNSKNLVEDCCQDTSSVAGSELVDLDLDLSRHGWSSSLSQNSSINNKREERQRRELLIENFELHGDNNHWWPVFRTHCGRSVNSKPVQLLVVGLIILDAIILGADTYDFNDGVFRVLSAIDLACLVIFNIEIVLQIVYLGPTNLIFYAPWRLFDLAIIVLSWVFYTGRLRALGVLRLFTAISKWDLLRTLFAAIGKTLPKMASIWIVLFVFFYTFTVIFTSLYSDAYYQGYMEYNNFENLKDTFLSLLQVMTLDSWSNLMRSLMESNPNAWIGFVVWIIITAFFFLNMIIAVICDSLREMAEIEQRKREKKLMKSQKAMLKNQRKEFQTELEKDRKIQETLLEQQQITQSLLFDILKAVEPNSVRGDKNAELRRRALAIKLPDFGFDKNETEEDAQTMEELEQMAAHVKRRALDRNNEAA